MTYNNGWDERREQVIQRDGYRCLLCGTVESELDGGLHVHHRTPRRQFADKDKADRLGQLVTLCSSCHGTLEDEERTRSVPIWKRKVMVAATLRSVE